MKTSDYKNIKSFIDWIITKNNIKEIIDEFEEQRDKGFVFERLFDLVIKFGYCNEFRPNNNFNHIISNVNNGIVDYLVNLQTYLNDNKVSSGNSGGASDITLYDIEKEQYIFISSKYPKSNEDIKKSKSIDYYDIQKIIAMIDDNKHIYSNYKIYLVVPNKKKVLDKVKQANKSSKYITKYMSEENILDEEDLNKSFLELKKDLIKSNFENYNNVFMKKKDKLMTRFHQKLINQKTSELIDDGEKQFLWACKCRSGKTFMAGGQIIDLLSNRENVNVLIITPAPTETLPQFTDDLFNSYIDFNNFKIHSITSGKMLKSLEIEKDTNNIFIASKQLLQDYTGEKKIKQIKNLDIIFSDENHFGSTTKLAKDIFNTYSSKKTVKIYLTATYNKPLKEWGIPENCQMYWDIEDEQICKSIYNDEKEILKLIEKHGPTVDEIINQYKKDGFTIKDIFKSYLAMPDLYLLTSLFDSDRYDAIKEKISDTVYGFSFETLFSLNTSKTRFKFENEVLTFFRYVSGSNKEEDFKKKDKSIFSRINKICSEKESRIPFTQIWFLPPNNINEISKALIKVIEKDNILSQYDLASINSKNSEIDASKIKQTINNFELNAKNNKKKGLILLAGNMLSLGITLSNCDVVMLLNNTLSSDKVMQQMYRCMTEGKDKKFGFVVDLNISRVLNTCINYSIHKKDLSIENKLKYMFDYHLMNIDVDMWDNKKLDSDYLINKLLDIWKNDPINNLRIMLRNLDNEYLEFDNETQKLLNKSFTSSANEKLSATIELKDENDESQSIQSGKETSKTEDSENEKELNDLEKDLLEEEKKEKEISFTKDVLPFVIPLTCILTMNDTNKDFVKMLYDIQQNNSLLEVFDEQSLIWWNKKDLIKIIKNIVEKFINKNSNTFNISINFKMGLKSLIDKPKELLELINECLKPKEIEKKKYGEVFTPMKLVNEMLDKLPKEVWENKDLKWLDPCVGMGNFMIGVYLRLMEGLKKEISNDKKRKKHILEKMIYMCELNKKNCYIVKQIFNINNEYKLNVYEGDFLKFDSNKKFNTDKYDIILGNPPYNKNNTGTGNSIWQFFVLNCLNLIKENGYLLFVHPSTWRKPQSEKSKMRGFFDLMTKNNKMLYLEIHNSKDGMKTFGCGTRYDIYLIKKEINNNNKTIVKDELGIISKINLTEFEWLPNYYFDEFKKILKQENDNSCELLFDCNIYETRRKWVSQKENKEYKYKLVNAINKDKIKFYYTNDNTKGMFGIKKIIFGTSGINVPLNDSKGEYGMTEHAMAIKYNNDNEAKLILECLKSNRFKELLKACNWSSFLLDWRLFTFFKKDFYKYFIENDNIVVKRSISNKIKKEDSESEDEKPKIKVKKNKSTMNKTK